MRNSRERKTKKKLWLVLSVAFASLCIGSIILFMLSQIQKKQENEALEELQSQVNEETDEELSLSVEDEEDVLAKLGIDIPEKDLDWEELENQNPDIYAWITVDGTDVDYPVLQPSEGKPNDFYCMHNVDGSYGYPGSINTEYLYNSKNFDDPVTVLYGHNMKNGSMFASLLKFADDEYFADDDYYIYVYTRDYVYVYRMFAAFEYSNLHILDNNDMSNEYVYEDFLKKIYKTTDRVANVKQDIEVTREDMIIILSTCTSDHNSSLRFLVAGVLVNPPETEE